MYIYLFIYLYIYTYFYLYYVVCLFVCVCVCVCVFSYLVCERINSDRLSLNSAKAKDETKMNKDKMSINKFFIKLVYP